MLMKILILTIKLNISLKPPKPSSKSPVPDSKTGDPDESVLGGAVALARFRV